MNTWKRRLLALLSVPLLAVPSAIGVYAYLEPQSGALGAGLAAAGFEVLYVGVNVLIISTPELRAYARNVSLGAVIVAVLMNSLAHYAQRVPDAYAGAAFAPLAGVLALIASAPLAGLAYAVSVLLHRLSEESASAGSVDPPANITQAVQVNVLQPNIVSFIAAHARALPDRDMAQLAAQLGTSTATIEQALIIAEQEVAND